MVRITAEIEGFGVETSVVCCFDPTVVIARLREVFPELIVSPLDSSWKNYVGLSQIDAGTAALRIAENDARRRGPIWLFELPVFGGVAIRGKAERYVVCFQSDHPIHEPYLSRIVGFMEELKFASCVELKLEDRRR